MTPALRNGRRCGASLPRGRGVPLARDGREPDARGVRPSRGRPSRGAGRQSYGASQLVHGALLPGDDGQRLLSTWIVLAFENSSFLKTSAFENNRAILQPDCSSVALRSRFNALAGTGHRGGENT
jgi:hypothetical protein